ncbi:MAG: CRISPR-associated helicase/endonuclease Cas3 [Polyangia bacterium]
MFELFWGKTRRLEDGSYAAHLFAHHSLDVAAVAAEWLDRDISISRALCGGSDKERATAWILFFSALHDLGKLDVRFQLKAPEVAGRLESAFDPRNVLDYSRYDHGQGGLAWFLRERDRYGFVNGRSIDWMQASAGHHGRLPRKDASLADKLCAEDSIKKKCRTAREKWLNALRDLFLSPVGIEKSSDPPPSPNTFAGFCSISDWVGSNESHFDYVEEAAGSLGGYFERRRENAARALSKSGILPRQVLGTGMRHLFPHIEKPRGVQRLIESWPLAPGLTLIEASTGSGKTEAALRYAARLIDAGMADGIVFALPTQATANAMFSRIVDVSAKLFKEGADLVLAHGKARFNPLFRQIKQGSPKSASAQGEEEATVQCSRWLSQSRKRVFLGNVGICTIDQALLSVLPVKHFFVRGAGIRRNVLIVDEVHAYDSYMNGLLDRVIEEQREAGGSVILLSATLPSHRTMELLEIYSPDREKREEPSSDYPLVCNSTSSGIRCWSTEEAGGERVVRTRIEATEDALPSNGLIEEISRRVDGGELVAVICNLVADAQALARKLRKILSDRVDLFHSRYRFKDRQRIEQQAIETYGKTAPRGSSGRVLVATQVVEQSLDLDFDWMISQICPVDLLFQRLGRLHRHDRGDRGTPEVAILVPSAGDYGLHQLVYGDPRLLWRTQELLERRNELVFPAAYRALIEEVYKQDAWGDEPAWVEEGHSEYETEQRERRARATQRSMVDTWLDDSSEEPGSLTRGSEMGATVVPIRADGGGDCFLDGETTLDSLPVHDRDEEIDQNSVNVPCSWNRFLPTPRDGVVYLRMVEQGNGTWTAELGEVLLEYTELYGLEKEGK